MWGQLSLGKMQAARGIGFRFLFSSGALLWYSWIAPKVRRGPGGTGAFPFLVSYHNGGGQ